VSFRFGVLPEPLRIRTHDWTVEPLPTFKKVVASWQGRGPDRFWVNPPIMHSARLRQSASATVWRKLAHSSHEAPVWRVPPTHRLVYTGQAPLSTRRSLSGLPTLLINVLGTITGVELQHSVWFLAGRQHKRTGGLFVTPSMDIARALD